MYNNILLINPWITDFTAYDFWLKPLGILYIAGFLRKYDYKLTLIDCMDRYDSELLAFQGIDSPNNKYFSTGKFYREIIAKPSAYHNVPRNFARYGLPIEIFRYKLRQCTKPDVVLMTSGMTYWYPGVQLAIKEVRKMYPNVPVVLGGIYPTLCRKHAIEKSGADLVISGAGELAALKAVDRLTGTKRNYDNFNDGLDELPYPAFELYKNLGYVTIMTSRGCPLKCTFCASSIVSGPYRQRAPESVVAEIEYYHKKLGIREFAFYDDALLTNHQKHLAVILDEIIIRGWEINFHTPNGLQCKWLDKEMTDKMFHAGVKSIRLSYESGNLERQKDICKKVNDEIFINAVNNLHRSGYPVGTLDAYIIVALPGQTIEEVLASIAFVHAQGVKIRLAVYSPIPGTVEWQRAKLNSNFPENADPLLSNNTIIPIKPPGTTFKTFEKIHLLVKNLNYNLANDRVHRDVKILMRQMKKQFSKLEICGIKAQAI